MDTGTIRAFAIFLAVILPTFAEILTDQPDCQDFKSCNSCLSKGSCVWCVNKAICTTDSCGNDNIIYPSHIRALMAGSQFCPRVVTPENKLVVQSGKEERIVVRITQIYMYMAFTPWKCKISQDGKETIVNATLVADEVFCEPVVLYSYSRPYADAAVSVLWEHSKAFDGALPLIICRCDMDPNCPACKKQR
ncbi:uncharacterized protein LOC134792478 [Cydia splendana]|uniref:uncharacterized protein LOC134792478 n=1 Tax=Cydia splendana TaxID=1100963 RepID=UPI002137CED2